MLAHVSDDNPARSAYPPKTNILVGWKVTGLHHFLPSHLMSGSLYPPDVVAAACVINDSVRIVPAGWAEASGRDSVR